MGRSVERRLFGDGPLADIPLSDLDHILDPLRACPDFGSLTTAEVAGAGQALVRQLSSACAGGPLDARVRAMIDYAAANLHKPLSLAAATSHIGLSPSRLRHLFVEETGLAFKTYILWLRIRHAVERYASGATLTEAAHAAAFSDSAHLSRTFRRTFGVPAASLKFTGD